MIRRALAITLVAIGLALAAQGPAAACSCVEADTRELVKQADTVAVGTVEWRADNGVDQVSYSVAFDQVYKGVAAQREKIITAADSAACGVTNLQPDQAYIFFIEGKHPGRLSISLCGGTTGYDVAVLDEVQQVTGDPVPPFPSLGGAEVVDDDGPNVIRWVGIGGFAVAALLIALVLARRRFDPSVRRLR